MTTLNRRQVAKKMLKAEEGQYSIGIMKFGEEEYQVTTDRFSTIPNSLRRFWMEYNGCTHSEEDYDDTYTREDFLEEEL